MRRLAGRLLVLGGAALLLAVGAAYARGWWERDRARARWAELEAERARRSASARLVAELEAPAAPGTPVARLVIPRIGLDEVIVEGVSDGELTVGPGHLPGTPLPGAPGNAVLAAHRDMHFRRLGRLRVGDTLTTQTLARTVRWRITGRRVVGADDPAIFPTTEPTLTLTTCWPMRYIGPAPDRLLLTAVPVDAAHPPVPARTASAERHR